MTTVNKRNHGLYIHIPFCMKKCDYCDFVSIMADASQHRRYVDAAIGEMQFWREAFEQKEISTVYLGGGTPSLIGAEMLVRVLDGVRRHFSLSPDAEITVEVNPGTVSNDFWKSMVTGGMNRVSIGVQSLSDRLLTAVGRPHDSASAIRAVKEAYDAGLENVGMDLIYGIPGQTAYDWAQTIEQAVDLGPTHLSIYALSYEEGTPLTSMREAGLVKPATDEDEEQMYYHALHEFHNAGFRRYELSNLALTGYESRHNMNYWNYGEYLGIGVAAHSFADGRRWENAGNVRKYMSVPYTGPSIVHDRTSVQGQLKEYIMLGLRKADGIALADIEERWGRAVAKNTEDIAQRLATDGLVEITKGRVLIADKGLFVSNTLIGEFF